MAELFSVEHLSGADGKVDDVSFHVKAGEIVGIAGLVGAGKSELCKTIFGFSFTFCLFTKEATQNCPSAAAARLNVNEILEICEQYTVMRNGQLVDNTPITQQTTTKEIVEKMLGRSFEESFPNRPAF